MATSNIESLIQKSAFTPGRGDIPKIIDLLASESEKIALAGERSLARAGTAAANALIENLKKAKRPQRARIVSTLSRIASGDAKYRAIFVELVEDPDLKTSLTAIRCLQDYPSDEIETLLIHHAEKTKRPECLRAVIRTLGRIGGGKSLAWLKQFESEKSLEALCVEAERIILRNVKKHEVSEIKTDVALNNFRVRLTCRGGLEILLQKAAAKLGFTQIEQAAGSIEGKFNGNLAELFKIRLFDEILFPVGDGFSSIETAVTSDASLRLIATLTQGLWKFRLDAPKESRAKLLSIVDAIKKRESRLVNDPNQSTWEARILKSGTSYHILWSPKQLDDPRFSYRKKDVPAASHPTIAATLAQIAGVREDDVVWDPFVGSGLELIERASLGKYRELIGTDLSPQAIQAAQMNADTAGFKVKLLAMDCLEFKKTRPTLIITNPPMGRRVQRGNMKELMHAFIPHAAKSLASGGRMVWLSPLPDYSRKIFQEMRLELKFAQMIDLGGFAAELQLFEKN